MRSKYTILMVLLFFKSSHIVASLQNNNSNNPSRSYDEIFSELALKTNLNTLKINGVPLLHHTVQRNLHGQVAALMRVGVDILALDKQGKMASYYAQDDKMFDIFWQKLSQIDSSNRTMNLPK